MKQKVQLGVGVSIVIVVAVGIYTARRPLHQEPPQNSVLGKSNQEPTAHNTVSPAFPMRVVVIPVEGMSCMACVSSVKKGLKNVDGVTEVEVSLEGRNAKVKYQTAKVTPELLASKINQLGYKAGTPVVENSK